MRFVRIFLLVLGLLVDLPYLYAEAFEPDCEKVKSQLDSVMSPQASQAVLEEIRSKNPQLIVLGEYHYDHLFWKMPHVYSYFKKLVPKVNCLFSEISQDTTQQEIDEMMMGIKNDIFYSNRRLGFGPLYESIYRQGDGVVLVDAPREEIAFQPIEDTLSTWLTRRDSYMIERIREAFSSQECSAGIYNVGAQHIRNNLGSSEVYSSFGERIKKNVSNVIVIEKGVSEELEMCEWQGTSSFIARTDNKQVREVFQLDQMGSSGDYILYLKSTEVMHALTTSDLVNFTEK